jgi:hypothetical protein
VIALSLDAFDAELARIETGLRQAASGDMDAVVMDAGAARGRELLLATWSEQAAPDGAPWVPRARPYGWPPLDRTGDMKASADVYPIGLSMTFIVADEKAAWHQYGTERRGVHIIPPRPMIFAEDERPTRWISGIETAMQARLDRWIGNMIGAAA